MDNMQELYEQKLKRITMTVNHQEPDIVPIMSLIETFAVGYAGTTIEECLNDREKEYQAYKKTLTDFYFDGVSQTCINRIMLMYKNLGFNSYFISNDKVTLQHEEFMGMEPEEYPLMKKDPIKFAIDVLAERKYPVLRNAKNDDERKEIIRESLKNFFDFYNNMMKYNKKFETETSIPVFSDGIAFAPLDLLFDYFRGFRGLNIDMMRRPSELIEAAEGLVDSMLFVATGGQEKLNPFPYIFTPLHIPTFIGPKKFGKFYWPSYKKMLLEIHKRGGKVQAFLEGNWELYYEFINELPKDFMIVMLEDDDLIKAKKIIGDTVTIHGGMPLNMLKYSSKEECFEHVKRIYDVCAPGGGFLFGTDKGLLSTKDVNVDTYRAVNEFAHKYGEY